MSKITLETNDLTKKYGKVTALDSVNLKVAKGEVFGYIGPNGAGKSTTIRLLLGSIRPTAGSSSIFGKDSWTDAVEIHKRVAFVPGEVLLWPNMTGGEVMDLFISLRGKHDKAKRDKLLKMFDLDPAKKCGTYSKGNRQKVALIAAFASDVDFFILDEPTSGLDPLMEQVFQQCVFEQKELGKGIFLSSHILSEVEILCDRVGIIREGKLVETGTMSQLRHLTRLSMSVETKRKIENLEKVKGIYDVVQNNKVVTFNIDTSELSNVISYISPFEVTKFESTPPTLEDLFMRHYDKNGGK